jgi:NADPH:quinone reductase-like Zn-dependent oxidoreductase
MRAIRLHDYGGPDVLQFDEDVAAPSIGPTGVLVATVATSVNPIDWKIRSGVRQRDFPLTLPAILGRDVSGIVRAVGAEVRTFKPGDRVLAMADATYAELVAVDQANLTHLPDGVDLTDAGALPLVALTGDQLVRGAAGIASGMRVLVSGALGGVGRAAVHCARKLGADVIAGVRRSQLADALALGATAVVAIDDDAAIGALPPLDAVADTVGGPTAEKLLGRVRTGGIFRYASVLPQSAPTQHPHVTVSRVFATPDAAKVREYADDLRDGRFVLPIGRRMSLQQAAEAHRLAEQGGIGKILLVC